MIEETIRDIQRTVDYLERKVDKLNSVENRSSEVEELFGFGPITLEAIARILTENVFALRRIEARDQNNVLAELNEVRKERDEARAELAELIGCRE